MFKGSLVALITPFRDGAVDEKAFQELAAWQIKEGTHGLVPCGTTGESPTLSHAEHKRVVELCIEVAKGKVPVIAGTGSNSTAEAIDFTRHAAKAGADAALVVTPYYNKPTQEGLYRHFKAIHDSAELPIIIYNVPPRSVVDMTPATMARLAQLPRIVGVKDATMDLTRPWKQRAAIGPGFCQLTGEDGTALPYLAQGGHGCISVTANVAPRLCSDFQTAMREGRWGEALKLQDRLYPLHSALFTDASPGPAKYALSRVRPGFPTELRLPLVEPSDASKRAVDAALEHAGLA
jgi:4-hydroxy-tetrahydrodipicolinate synthase